MEIHRNHPLRNLNTWLVGGAADHYVSPKNSEELRTALAFAESQRLPVTVLGAGSNVLISDEGIAGLVIGTSQLRTLNVVEAHGELVLTAEVGVRKSDLLKVFLQKKLAPALFLAGLPGDVGGGLVMNAGVSENFVPREFAEITRSIQVMRPTGEIVEIQSGDLHWAYRHLSGWQPGVIVSARIAWPLVADPEVLTKVREANRVRLSKQPLDMPSCGSVFVNPPGRKAAQLIDSAGLKGYSVGGAMVSTKHANFIVNTGPATAGELWAVMQHVAKEVARVHGVQLQSEVVRMGRW